MNIPFLIVPNYIWLKYHITNKQINPVNTSTRIGDVWLHECESLLLDFGLKEMYYL